MFQSPLSEPKMNDIHKYPHLYNRISQAIMLMLMLMPVSAGPAESPTCSRAIAVMAPDSHTPNTRQCLRVEGYPRPLSPGSPGLRVKVQQGEVSSC